jgi:hypothetical protein
MRMTAAMQMVTSPDLGKLSAPNGDGASSLNGKTNRIKLFTPDDVHADNVTQALVLMSYLSGRTVPKHWPKDQRPDYNAAARSWLKSQPRIRSEDPEKSSDSLEKLLRVYSNTKMSGPGHVGIFLRTGKWPDDLKVVD